MEDAENMDDESFKKVIGNCDKCSSSNIVRLWRTEIVCPGDNSDNSVKAWKFGCLDCGHQWLERIKKIN